ncbi:MAG: diguanylate cyclase [Chloroflexi bacterium]|nr:diguanylate cyclase [Chloroflexota bacterium]
MPITRRKNRLSGAGGLKEGKLSPRPSPLPPGDPGHPETGDTQDLYQAFIDLNSVGIWRMELEQPLAISQPEDTQLEQLLKMAYLGECNPACAQISGYTGPQEVVGLKLHEFLGISIPSSMDLIRAIIHSGYRLTNIETQSNDDSEVWFVNNIYGIIERGYLIRLWGTLDEISTRKRNEKIQAALYKISQATHSTQNLQELYHSIHQTLGELMPAQNFFIAFYDPATDMLSFPYFVDENDRRPEPKKAGRGLTEYVLRTGKPLLASPIDFEELVRQGEVETIGAPSIDWLGVPLIANNQVIGVLAVQTYTEGVRYGQEEKDILGFVSTQVAMALDRKRAEERLRVNEARYRAIVEDQTELICRFLPDFTLTFVNEAFCRYFGKDRADLIGSPLAVIIHPDDQGMILAGLASLNSESPVLTLEHRGIKAGGVATWEQWSNRAIFDETGKVIEFQAVGRDISDRKKVEDELRYLSTHDRLTGIYNRAYFEEEMARLERGRQFPVSVLMADVDGLKEINDSHGHYAGDDLLKRTAEVLRAAFRAQDVVARIGGDEFGILLPGSNAEVAQKILERVRENLEVHNQQNSHVPIRLSLGYATALKGSQITEAYKQADTIMYQEKFQVRARRVQDTLMGIKRSLGEEGEPT